MFDIKLLEYLESYLTEERRQRFVQILSERTKYLTVVIEDVYQLHNTSAVIRSCDAFGIQEVHVIEDRFGPDSHREMDKNIALGAQKWVDVHRYPNSRECINNLRAQGYQLIATTPHTDSKLLSDFKLSSKTALFFGTEKEGLTEEILKEADGYLKIPMVGFSESLNVSVAAAIAIHDLTNQLRRGNLPWQLSEREMLEKRLDWVKKSIKNVEGIIERYQSD